MLNENPVINASNRLSDFENKVPRGSWGEKFGMYGLLNLNIFEGIQIALHAQITIIRALHIQRNKT